MKRFLVKSISFSGALLLLLIILFWISVELNRKLYRNVSIDPGITTLVIGDSHTELAVNDSLLPNTLNISTPAEGYIFTYLKLKNILSQNSHIRNIILGASYHNFSSYYDKYIFEEEPYYLISQYLSLMNYKEILGFIRKSSSVKNLAAIFRNSFKNIIEYKKDYYPYIGGFHVIDNTDLLTSERIIKRIDSQYYLNNRLMPPSAINKSYFNKILDLCNEKGVCLILLNTPLYSEYFSRIPSEYLNEYQSMINNCGAIEINFSNLKLSADCFLPDGDHLRYRGAMLTTQYLVEFLKSTSYNMKSGSLSGQ